MGLGLGSNHSILLVKGGACYRQIYDIPLTFHPNPGQTFPKITTTEFDYGLEYLWINSDTNKITFLYGLSCTHCNGVQLKLGLAF